MHVVVDGKPGPAYDVIGRAFSFSVRIVSTWPIWQDGNKQFIVVDGKPGPAYDEIGKVDHLQPG